MGLLDIANGIRNSVQNSINDVVGKLSSPLSGRVKPTSELQTPTPAAASFAGAVDDTRVRLLVPESYLYSDLTQGPNFELGKIGGILFPYTPTINQDYRANYNSFNAVHSNYTQYFYKNSAVGEISVSGRFTVQNETEAGIYLSTIHLLRSLVKMKFGDDVNAGSPPPVCRLMAYGPYMFDNVPVAVSNFRVDLVDDVDFYTITSPALTKLWKTATVPTRSIIALTLVPIYSRQEMLAGTVKGWMKDGQRPKGYL